MNQEEIKALTDKVAGVVGDSGSVNVWNNRRIYINMFDKDRSFKGERFHQLYVDINSGQLHNEFKSGTVRREYHDAVDALVSDMKEAGY